jgi:hypothetical protein
MVHDEPQGFAITIARESILDPLVTFSNSDIPNRREFV